jgi:hypothetical protein
MFLIRAGMYDSLYVCVYTLMEKYVIMCVPFSVKFHITLSFEKRTSR